MQVDLFTSFWNGVHLASVCQSPQSLADCLSLRMFFGKRTHRSGMDIYLYPKNTKEVNEHSARSIRFTHIMIVQTIAPQQCTAGFKSSKATEYYNCCFSALYSVLLSLLALLKHKNVKKELLLVGVSSVLKKTACMVHIHCHHLRVAFKVQLH